MLFSENVILERKSRAQHALDQVLGSDEVVLVYAGEPVQKPGGHDQTYSFLPHPDYFWLTGIRRPSGVSAYSKNDGWVDFIQPITRDEKIWEGGLDLAPGKDLAQFESWLKSNKFKNIYSLGQNKESLSLNPESDIKNVLESYNNVRRVKDAAEIELIRKLATMANAGYSTLKTFVRPGVTERQIQIAYESEVFKAGSETMPYGTIVGTGTNAAVLHATPSHRVVKEGEMVLVDGGADVQDYCVDITRVFAANGKFTSQQQSIYDIVLRAQTASIALCRPGVEWKDVHLASAREISEGLRALNVLNCSSEEAIESGAVAVFFPHGVGHMVGLRVRDVGGKYNPNPRRHAGARLRVDMPLSEGYLMTVEPGLYFIEALLKDSETRQKFKNHINWTEVEKWMTVGGVRLEDDIHVTAKGPVNLTEIVEK